MSFFCTVPGADPVTAIFHSVVHLGMTAFIVVAGAWFLAKSVIAYRATAVRATQ